MRYNKETLENLILVEKISYEQIGKSYGVSGGAIKKAAKRLCINLPARVIFKNKNINIKRTPKLKQYRECLNCCSDITNLNKYNKFCNSKCASEYVKKETYKNFLENNEKFCYANYSPGRLKWAFLEEQNNKCTICGMENVWNEKKLIFVLDHIDGNAANNKRENLRLICPNCDSQLDTYKSKNKNSARVKRYKKI